MSCCQKRAKLSEFARTMQTQKYLLIKPNMAIAYTSCYHFGLIHTKNGFNGKRKANIQIKFLV